MASRLDNLFDDESFLNILDTQMKLLASQKNVKTYPYFANKLGFNGVNAGQQLLNHFDTITPKYLKIIDFFLILDNLESHKKPVLDYICKKYNFVCSCPAQPTNKDYDNIKDLLIHLGGSNGNIYSKFHEYTKDNHLSNDEIDSLIDASYEARQELIQFENSLKQMIDND